MCRCYRFPTRTNFLHREDDESDANSTQDQEGTNADDATDLECQGDYLNEGETVEDNDEDESGEEITGLEEVVTSVVNDLSNDYTCLLYTSDAADE